MNENTILDPKKETFLNNYTNPSSETFGNATQSGIQAGFSKSYSENITHLNPNWLSEYIGNTGVLDQAKANMATWVNTDDERLLGFKYKASEKILDMVATATTKKEDALEGLLKKNSLSSHESVQIRNIVIRHGLNIWLPIPPIPKEEIERMGNMLREPDYFNIAISKIKDGTFNQEQLQQLAKALEEQKAYIVS